MVQSRGCRPSAWDDWALFLIHCKVSAQSFCLLDPPNRLLQREDTQLMTGLSIVTSVGCVWKLSCGGVSWSVGWCHGCQHIKIPKWRHKMNRNIQCLCPHGNYRVQGWLRWQQNKPIETTALLIQCLEKRITDSFLEVKAVNHVMNLSWSPIIETWEY